MAAALLAFSPVALFAEQDRSVNVAITSDKMKIRFISNNIGRFLCKSGLDADRVEAFVDAAEVVIFSAQLGGVFLVVTAP